MTAQRPSRDQVCNSGNARPATSARPGHRASHNTPAHRLPGTALPQWEPTLAQVAELRVPPDGCTDLIRHDVVGSLARPLTVTFRPGDTSQGVRFHPGGFPALFRMPASELVDVRLPVADVLPRFRSLRALAQGAPLPLISSQRPGPAPASGRFFQGRRDSRCLGSVRTRPRCAAGPVNEEGTRP
jgi:Domain of unknown function (DUF6597)